MKMWILGGVPPVSDALWDAVLLVGGVLWGGAALQCVRENSFSSNPVERNVPESSPGGASELSPALQRWEKRRKLIKSRRDDRVLAHTLQRCDRGIDLSRVPHPCAFFAQGWDSTLASRRDLLLHLLLGGAALQRCDRGIDWTKALAPEVAP